MATLVIEQEGVVVVCGMDIVDDAETAFSQVQLVVVLMVVGVVVGDVVRCTMLWCGLSCWWL